MISLTPSCPAAETINLAGSWRFQLDRENTGATERWFTRPLPATCSLPGSLPGQGIGDPVTVATKWTGSIFDKSYFTSPDYAAYRQPGNIKVPFWLQPETHYVGASWFQRNIEIPAGWSGQRLVLRLERPHWRTTLWLDDREIGSADALSVPHEYDLGTAVAPGRHTLTLRVDNALQPDVGENSHSVSDHTQGNWNGIVGRIELTTTAPVWIEGLQVFPRVADRVALVRGRVAASAGQTLPSTIRLAAGLAQAPLSQALDASVAADGRFSVEYPLGHDAPLWDEFTPTLHRLTATLPNGEQREVTFGLRELAAVGRQFMLNGRPVFFRGTLDCAAFPRTGHPPLDIASWKRQFAIIQAHGLNHVRFHSWCPPEAAFIAADELGLYLQVEVASWPNWSTKLGDNLPVDAWLEAESERIVRAYGNHPSFVLFCSSNEPAGPHHQEWLAGWVSRRKASDPRRLHAAAAGWPELPESDYHVLFEPRIQLWLQGLESRINRFPPETRTDYRDFIGTRTAPVISHEIGQWCAYPNLAEMAKYTGYLKPRNFEIFQASLAAHGLAGQAREFLLASGKLQALCYKEDIESALRTSQMGGFQLLGLNDFPGQGTALVGVLDAFWEEKGYISPAEFKRFCGPIVPLARLERRVFTTDEHLTADLEIAHFGAAPLDGAVARWQLVADSGEVAAGGQMAAQTIPLGGPTRLGRLDLGLDRVPAPARYKLVVTIAGTTAANDWDLWVYPPAAQVVAPPSPDLLVTTDWNATSQTRLAAGGTVVLTIPPARVPPDPVRGKIALGFSSIFWNTAWTNGQAPHTLGILCNPQHPALADFPTDSHTNWQWWYPITQAAPMILDGLPSTLRPIVQVVDDWFTNRKLGLVFEAKVGAGRLLVTSIDLKDAALDPVRRQLRASLLRYAASPQFAPSVEISPQQIGQLITPLPAP